MFQKFLLMIVFGIVFSAQTAHTQVENKDPFCADEASGVCKDAGGELMPKRKQASESKKNVFAVDHRPLTKILTQFVNDGWVDYKGLLKGWKQADHPLKQYLARLEKPTLEEVDRWPRQDQMAYFINAYNAYTLKLILDNYPVDSIKEIGKNFLRMGPGPWKQPIVRLMQEVHDLNWIEHDVLRPRYKDARVHAAINCASKGCPKLQSWAFEGAKLDAQLELSFREFVNDSVRNKYDLAHNRATLSSIFDWFADDFKPSVRKFLLKFVEGDAQKLLRLRKLKIDYEYDWDLNEK